MLKFQQSHLDKKPYELMLAEDKDPTLTVDKITPKVYVKLPKPIF